MIHDVLVGFLVEEFGHVAGALARNDFTLGGIVDAPLRALDQVSKVDVDGNVVDPRNQRALHCPRVDPWWRHDHGRARKEGPLEP